MGPSLPPVSHDQADFLSQLLDCQFTGHKIFKLFAVKRFNFQQRCRNDMQFFQILFKYLLRNIERLSDKRFDFLVDL